MICKNGFHCLILLWSFSLVTVGCDFRNDNSLRDKFLDEVTKAYESKNVFAVENITDFDWDRMDFLDSDSGIDQNESAKLMCAEGISISSHTFAVIFIADSEITKFFEIPYSDQVHIWITDCTLYANDECRSFSNTRASARFLVEKSLRPESGGITYLLKCSTQK